MKQNPWVVILTVIFATTLFSAITMASTSATGGDIYPCSVNP